MSWGTGGKWYNPTNRTSVLPVLQMFQILILPMSFVETEFKTRMRWKYNQRYQLILNTKMYSQVHLPKCRWWALHNRCLSLENHCKGGRMQALEKAAEIPAPTHQRRLHKRDNLFSEYEAKKSSVLKSVNETRCR